MSNESPDIKLPDPAEFAETMARIAERSQNLITEFASKQDPSKGFGMADPLNVTDAFVALTKQMMADPARFAEAQAGLWNDYMKLWQSTTAKMFGGAGASGAGSDSGNGDSAGAPVAVPDKGDRRFKDDAWRDNALFDYLKQSYLLTARWMQNTVADVEGLDEKTARKVDFYTQQFVDAMSPTNFAATNPEVLRETMASGGENLVRGLENLLGDLERGKGKLAISMTDESAFEVGVNVATAPGKVVYQNELMQLLQFDPSTETVHKRPLLIVPPWINKFYILDLREKNSFIRWAVAQGFTVFVVSWVNPGPELADKTFEDYMLEGPMAALDAIEQATGEPEANVIGYCIGGTLMAATLATMAAKDDNRVRSATFFTTMVDFTEPGDLGVFIDEEQIQALEERMDQEGGVLDGSAMATTFNMMRSNDLIWSFVVNNYLMGKDPFPFDLLYWNSDSTRMPKAMHSFYLRHMYERNELVQPGVLAFDGVPIDLGQIKVPVFILSTKDDHIAPWKSTYAATGLYGGPVKFCLSGSGHIAGVVNPPQDPPKYGYWTNAKKPPKDPETWLSTAKQHTGSWWPEWSKWLSRHGGGKVPARMPGDGGLPAIEDAPGSYVKVRARD